MNRAFYTSTFELHAQVPNFTVVGIACKYHVLPARAEQNTFPNRFYLTTSVLAFQTYSNKHSVVKLTSRLLTVEDTRPASGNSFPLVVTHRDSFEPESLQVEVRELDSGVVRN